MRKKGKAKAANGGGWLINYVTRGGEERRIIHRGSSYAKACTKALGMADAKRVTSCQALTAQDLRKVIFAGDHAAELVAQGGK